MSLFWFVFFPSLALFDQKKREKKCIFSDSRQIWHVFNLFIIIVSIFGIDLFQVQVSD